MVFPITRALQGVPTLKKTQNFSTTLMSVDADIQLYIERHQSEQTWFIASYTVAHQDWKISFSWYNIRTLEWEIVQLLWQVDSLYDFVRDWWYSELLSRSLCDADVFWVRIARSLRKSHNECIENEERRAQLAWFLREDVSIEIFPSAKRLGIQRVNLQKTSLHLLGPSIWP